MRRPPADPLRPPTSYELAVLGALQGRQVYQGTVAPNDRLTRRRRNKAARVSRRANRRAA